jgi:hypothetical protein
LNGNRRPARGPIVDARRAIATIDESSSEAERRLAEELIAEGLQYAASQLRGLPTRAMYLRDAVTELTAMRETFARTWRPVATAVPVCVPARVVEIEAFRTRNGGSP